MENIKKGDIITVCHKNSVQDYYYDGINLIDTKGNIFEPSNGSWEKFFENEDNWHLALRDGTIAFIDELESNGFVIDKSLNVVKAQCKNDVPYNQIFSLETEECVLLRKKVRGLIKLLDEIQYICDTSIDGVDKKKDDIFQKIESIAEQRYLLLKNGNYEEIVIK